MPSTPVLSLVLHSLGERRAPDPCLRSLGEQAIDWRVVEILFPPALRTTCERRLADLASRGALLRPLRARAGGPAHDLLNAGLRAASSDLVYFFSVSGRLREAGHLARLIERADRERVVVLSGGREARAPFGFGRRAGAPSSDNLLVRRSGLPSGARFGEGRSKRVSEASFFRELKAAGLEILQDPAHAVARGGSRLSFSDFWPRVRLSPRLERWFHVSAARKAP